MIALMGGNLHRHRDSERDRWNWRARLCMYSQRGTARQRYRELEQQLPNAKATRCVGFF